MCRPYGTLKSTPLHHLQIMLIFCQNRITQRQILFLRRIEIGNIIQIQLRRRKNAYPRKKFGGSG